MIDEQSEIIDKVKLKASILSLRNDGIMHIRLRGGDELKPEDINDIFNGLYKIGAGKKFANLITFENCLVVGKETRAQVAKEISGKYTVADAIVVKSVPIKLTANFYITFNKPIRPTRSFSSEEKAIEWLKTFL